MTYINVTWIGRPQGFDQMHSSTALSKARVAVLRVTQLLKAFNPSQQRDEYGRWSGEGSLRTLKDPTSVAQALLSSPKAQGWQISVGNKLIELVTELDGDNLHVHWVGLNRPPSSTPTDHSSKTDDPEIQRILAHGSVKAAGNSVGPKVVRELVRAIRRKYPNVKRLAGTRISGSKVTADGRAKPTVSPLLKSLSTEFVEQLNSKVQAW